MGIGKDENDNTKGVSKLMDVLGETREVLRNDSLILLFKLTKGILLFKLSSSLFSNSLEIQINTIIITMLTF